MGFFDLFRKKKDNTDINKAPQAGPGGNTGNLTCEDIIKNPAEELEKLVSDPVRYRAYLENVLSRISFNKKDQIMRTVLRGDKAEAMRECQRTAGEGLRIVKDLMDNYLILPNLKYFSSRIYIKDATRADIEDSLREYGEIYTDTASGNAYIGAVYGTDWNYVEFYAAVSDPVSFSYDIFLNVLIWMSQKSTNIFAYAKPNQTAPAGDGSALGAVGAWADVTPFYATIDTEDRLGESCIGIINNKNCRFVVPDLTLSLGDSMPQDFDLENFLEDKYGVDLGH